MAFSSWVIIDLLLLIHIPNENLFFRNFKALISEIQTKANKTFEKEITETKKTESPYLSRLHNFSPLTRGTLII